MATDSRIRSPSCCGSSEVLKRSSTVTRMGSAAIAPIVPSPLDLEPCSSHGRDARAIALLRQGGDRCEEQLTEPRVVPLEDLDHRLVRDRRDSWDADVVVGDERDV